MNKEDYKVNYWMSLFYAFVVMTMVFFTIVLLSKVVGAQAVQQYKVSWRECYKDEKTFDEVHLNYPAYADDYLEDLKGDGYCVIASRYFDMLEDAEKYDVSKISEVSLGDIIIDTPAR